MTDWVDLIIDPAASALASSVTPADFFDPSVFDAALTGLAAPGGWETLLSDLTSISSSGLVLPETSTAATDAGSAAAAADSSTAFWQGLEQSWINSSFGQQVDTSLNTWFAQADPTALHAAADPTGGACGLICNGANGVGGGSL
ncbi:MAG TPA: hypothetical protein VHS97_11630, partial [Isosphaeraceae bacterium]|nr:hypothetical protein [Isosphaeraceae bacterium]